MKGKDRVLGNGGGGFEIYSTTSYERQGTALSWDDSFFRNQNNFFF